MSCLVLNILGLIGLGVGVLILFTFYARRYREIERSTPARVEFLMLGTALLIMGLLLFFLGQTGMLCGGPDFIR